ncbi:MAG TPA: CHASE domain-containing protein [Thermoanaerobaculia bacterium]|nr:CHASE domain-containing protein [Thermoanaerobaculia bacterium]
MKPAVPSRDRIAPFVVLGIFLLITALATSYVWNTSRFADRTRFEVDVGSTLGELSNRMDVYTNVLRAASGLFAADQYVTRDQFRAYVRHLQVQDRYPGIQGIGISVRVRPEIIDDVVSDIRANDFADFRIWPEGPRDEYHTIVLLEPVDRRNRMAIGYDMYTNPVRRTAMARARDSAEPAASRLVSLVQEVIGEQQPGFLLYVPIYTTREVPSSAAERRQSLYGFVYAPFRTVDLFNSLFGRELPGGMAVEIFDNDQQLFAAGPKSEDPRFTATRFIGVAGRTWTVRFASTESWVGTPIRNALGTAAVGLILSGLLFALLRTQAAARAIAEQTTETLMASEAELVQASRAKDEFLATLSHELRTPMTAIMGWSQLLDEPLDPESQKTAIDSIQKSARSQAQLIDDLLDVSRITSGKMRIEPRPIDLNAVVSAAVSAVAPAAEAKSVTLQVEVPAAAVRVYGDANRLQQVLWNLISNAAKFTPIEGSVRVELRVDGNEAHLAVTDTGEGIDPAFLPHVFERFRQADSSTTRPYAGLGLGLAIVRHLVELHGGTVDAASEGIGRGSQFTVRLPLLQVRTGRAETERHVDEESLAGLRGAKILVVDDEEDVRNFANTVFRMSGAEVRAVGSAAEALRACAEWMPDVVVSDIGMPDTDGYELLRQLREWSAVPVVALTAYARPEDRARAEEAGFDDYIAKPVDPKELRAVVAGVVGAAGARR